MDKRNTTLFTRMGAERSDSRCWFTFTSSPRQFLRFRLLILHNQSFEFTAALRRASGVSGVKLLGLFVKYSASDWELEARLGFSLCEGAMERNERREFISKDRSLWQRVESVGRPASTPSNMGRSIVRLGLDLNLFFECSMIPRSRCDKFLASPCQAIPKVGPTFGHLWICIYTQIRLFRDQGLGLNQDLKI